jgi:hypothetical protein
MLTRADLLLLDFANAAIDLPAACKYVYRTPHLDGELMLLTATHQFGTQKYSYYLYLYIFG